MPIAEELVQFQNEDDFVKRFLVPLFRRLGFVIVANYQIPGTPTRVKRQNQVIAPRLALRCGVLTV
jgi:hypothetical protein